MSHEIEKPIDIVLSTEGTEWHGLADAVESINDDNIRPLLFPILSGGMILNMGMNVADGSPSEQLKALRSAAFSVLNKKEMEDEAPADFVRRLISAVRHETAMPGHKGLAGDFRAIRPDLLTHESGGLVPLHIPKNSYGEITNGDLWEVTKKALADVDAKVSCVGTLKAGKVFFISVKLGDGGKFTVKRADGGEDQYLANLNLITSHDGTLGVEAYDSTTRIVCMNTLRWSREAAGEIKFKVYHTANRAPAMANLGDLVNRILTGRANFRDSMTYLSGEAISQSDAEKLIAGYFVRAALAKGVKESEAFEFSTQKRNAIEEITSLFKSGKGNAGKSLYDLLNGFTEYYTQGDGTGKKTSKEEKLCKANFGEAANHKDAFVNLLMSDADTLKEAKEQGEKANRQSAE